MPTPTRGRRTPTLRSAPPCSGRLGRGFLPGRPLAFQAPCHLHATTSPPDPFPRARGRPLPRRPGSWPRAGRRWPGPGHWSCAGRSARARELVWPMRVISSRVLAPAVEASVLPVCRRSWKCNSAVTPAAFRAFTPSALRRGRPPLRIDEDVCRLCGSTKTCVAVGSGEALRMVRDRRGVSGPRQVRRYAFRIVTA
jgi:hypothetical protein